LKIHFNIILPSTLMSSKWSLSLRFRYGNHVCTCSLSHMWYIPRPSHYSLFDNSQNILWGVTYHKAPRYVVFSIACCLFSLRPKYLPQHPILEQSLPMFLRQSERPSFTPVHNNRQNYSSVYLNLYIIGFHTGRQTILLRKIASIPWLQSSLNFLLNRILIR
jgi:hypothetical protein